MKFLAILMAGKPDLVNSPPLSSDNKLWREADVRSLRRQPDFSHRKGYMGTVASRV
jgi:hypothetical protein